MSSWLTSSNPVDKAQEIRILLKEIYNMLGKYKKVLSCITIVLNVVFVSIWYESFVSTQRHDTHSRLFSIYSSRFLPEDKEPYLLPIHCEQVFI